LIEVDPTIEANIHTVLEDHTAGDPMRAAVEWKKIARSRKKAELGLPTGYSCPSDHGLR
jgi:hypothetical protein